MRRILLIAACAGAALAHVASSAEPAPGTGRVVVIPLPADEDFLEPSVRNEVDHAISLLPTNAPAPATPRDFALVGTNGLSRTALAIRLVSLQRPSGRFLVGTNDVTAAAAGLLRGM